MSKWMNGRWIISHSQSPVPGPSYQAYIMKSVISSSRFSLWPGEKGLMQWTNVTLVCPTFSNNSAINFILLDWFVHCGPSEWMWYCWYEHECSRERFEMAPGVGDAAARTTRDISAPRSTRRCMMFGTRRIIIHSTDNARGPLYLLAGSLELSLLHKRWLHTCPDRGQWTSGVVEFFEVSHHHGKWDWDQETNKQIREISRDKLRGNCPATDTIESAAEASS